MRIGIVSATVADPSAGVEELVAELPVAKDSGHL